MEDFFGRPRGKSLSSTTAIALTDALTAALGLAAGFETGLDLEIGFAVSGAGF